VKPETLHDRIYKRSFNNRTNPGWRNNADMRNALQGAKRFVASDSMSSFMAELANESFVKAGPTPLSMRIADSLRVQARPPHESVWIEYNLHAYQKRTSEIRGTVCAAPDEMPEREGWLIQAHPKLGDTACIMHLFNSRDDRDKFDGFDTWTFPFAFAWTTDDSPLPWHPTVKVTAEHRYASPSSYLVGIGGYLRDNVYCVRSPLIEDPKPRLAQLYSELLREWTGVVRRVWALLATIDNLPLIYGQTRQSKGFLARGRIRPFLSHQTVTLNIPAKKDSRVIARQAIAHAHRRRHEVRAFWRNDFRHPLGNCAPHLWEMLNDSDHIRCELCGGRQVYVHRHERGNASVGYVTHSYVLEHKGGDDENERH
jgi:hypothetical protein